MKRALLIAMCLLVVFVIITGCSNANRSNQSEEESNLNYVPSEGLKFALTSDGEGYELVSIGTCTDVDVYIPSTYNGKPVTSIGFSAFIYSHFVKSITIPDTVTAIATQAFSGATSLETINLPNSITELDLGIFYYCNSLEKIILPESLERITSGGVLLCNNMNIPFNEYQNGLYLGTKKNPYLVLVHTKNSELTEFTVHKDTKFIADGAFFLNGVSIETIHLSNSVKYIGYDAFRNCVALKNINIPDSIEYIGANAFANCQTLENIILPDSLDYVGAIMSDVPMLKYTEYDNAMYLGNNSNPYLVLIRAKDTNIESCKVHKDTKIIAELAFSGCRYLVNIDIADSVETIGKEAFYDCTSLESVTLPKSLKKIYFNTFFRCNSLAKLVIPESVKEVEYITYKTQIPDSDAPIVPIDIYYEGTLKKWLEIDFKSVITSDLGNLYINNQLVTDLVIPEGEKSINNNAFAQFKSIKSVKIPNGVTSVGMNAFLNCTSIESVILPDSLVKIGASAFKNCESLVNINIPNSVVEMGPSAFSGCDSLKNVTIPNSIQSISGVFSGCKSLESVVLPNSLIYIGNNTFSGCVSLTDIIIPESVTDIADNAFADCTSLKYTVENNVYYLGNANNPYLYLVKCEDTSITEFTIPQSTKVVKSDAFASCDALAKINIPEHVSNIDYLDYSNYILASPVNIPINLIVMDVHPNNQHYTLIDGNLYSKDGRTLIKYLVDDEVDSFEVPNTVVNIAQAAFAFNTKIKNIIIADSVTRIGEGTFAYCVGLESVTLSKAITKIGEYTFAYCRSIKSIVIPDSVFYILNNAFMVCKKLTDVKFGNSILNIGYSAFSGCSSLTDLVIPDSVTTIEQRAFYRCNNIKTVEFGKSLNIVGMEAFSGCDALESLRISSTSLISCGHFAFDQCNIIRIDFSGTIEEWKVVGESLSRKIIISTNFTAYCTDGKITRAGEETYY